MSIHTYLNKIICKDSIQVIREIPENCIDLGITSPPYNKGEDKKGWLVKNIKYSGASDNLPEDIYQEMQIYILNEIYRIIKPGGSFFYNHKIRWEKGYMHHPMDWLRKTKWVIRQEIIWDRGIAANIRGWRFWQVDERIYWLYKPIGNNLIGKELKSKHALLTSIWRFPPETQNPHPAPFPIELPTRIIHALLDDQKGIVIDPYCGSGTTLVAAKLLGHDYIGIDISQEYVAYAEARLRNCEREKSLVQEEVKKHRVQKTFRDRKERGEYTGPHRPKPHEKDLFHP